MNKMTDNSRPIGVFDSGVGGISVLAELWKLMPNENYIYFGDSINAPYGTKSESEIKMHTENSIKKLTDIGVKAVVIACNTATSIAAKEIRQNYSLPIIGIEPAVKPAAINHKGENIVVMATPMTLKKEKFLSLMNSYGDIANIMPLPCPQLVEIIEKGITDGEEIQAYLTNLFASFEEKKINSIVLGCTHYPFIKKAIRNYFDYKIDIIDGGAGTARETKRRLNEENLLSLSQIDGKIEFINSKNSLKETTLMKNMFELIKNP